MAVQFDHVGIVSATADDNLKVAEFFRDVLNCQVEGNPRDGYAEVRIGGSTVALHVGARTELGPHGGTLIHLTTKDTDAEVAAIRARGGIIAVNPEDLPWGRSAYVAGPNGVMIEIYQPS